jgi:hypothetical protein
MESERAIIFSDFNFLLLNDPALILSEKLKILSE